MLKSNSSNYSKTTGTLWFYSKDEANDFNPDIINNNNFKSFKYKAKLLGKTESQPNPNNVHGILKIETLDVPLKYLSNFWRSLEIELQLKWKSIVFYLRLVLIMQILIILYLL